MIEDICPPQVCVHMHRLDSTVHGVKVQAFVFPSYSTTQVESSHSQLPWQRVESLPRAMTSGIGMAQQVSEQKHRNADGLVLTMRPSTPAHC